MVIKEKQTISASGLGILPKLLISFLVLSCVPLVVLGYVANKNMEKTGIQAVQKAQEMGDKNLKSSIEIGRTAIENSVRALDDKSTEAIELRTVELAQRIADFLYERDQDLMTLSSYSPDPKRYLQIYSISKRDVVVHGPWPLDEPRGIEDLVILVWQNPENKESWRHYPPDAFKRETRPLYKEITFIDLKGREKIKVLEGKVSRDLRDISKKENTYCRAEDYFQYVPRLKKGEIYVSRVIGAQLKGSLMRTSEGMKVTPESGYAGKENPAGKRYEGIVRWATPVYGQKGGKIGYVTMALDHIHIMEFTDHVVPTEERFSDISDAGSGNYAFLWDDQDQCISHPRDFFICGYDPETGQEVPGWVSQDTYSEYRMSGLTILDFVRQLPSFRHFSLKKPGSKEQIEAGHISLDCRVLDTAPQCQGWHRGTEDGGSGSFLIYWSGLWKLTTYAAVPYYTGIYANSKRGFGYVTIGANVSDFHKAANKTREDIEASISEQGADIDFATTQTRELIKQNALENRKFLTIIVLISALLVIGVSFVLSLTMTRPLKRLTASAIFMSQGYLDQSIEVASRDEIGQLAQAFNEMATAVSEVDQMKSDFVTIASHELRTPIHAMMLGVSGLLEGYAGEINDEAREDLDLVKDGIQRLTRLVDNLLDISRIEARKTELHIIKTSGHEMVDMAVEEVSELAESHHHLIVKDVSPSFPVMEVDKDRIIQVLVNLLSNSIKYSPDHSKIVIKGESNDDEVIFSVADNGYGIPGWAQEKIFDKFFQADSIMSKRVGGSGLGLTISKGIIVQHGGTITCESPIPEGESPGFLLDKERRGTVFIIHLPRK